MRHWRRIRELLHGIPATEETLRLRLRACSGILGIGWRLFLSTEEADRLLAEGREIAERLGDRTALLHLLDLHGTYQSLFGDVDRDQLLGRTHEALAIADEIHDTGLRVTLLQRLGWIHILRADVRAGMEACEEGLRLARGDTELGRDTTGHSALIYLETFRAFFLMFAGRITEATEQLERAIADARRIGDEDSLQFPLGQTSAHAFFAGDATFALPRVLETVEITTRIGNRWGLVMAYSCLGHTYVVAREWQRALDAFDREDELRGDLEQPYGRTWILHGRAEAYLGLDDAARALELAAEGVRIAREHRWPYPEAVGLLTLARAMRRTGSGAIGETLSRLDAIIGETGMVVLRAFVDVERAERAGDAARRRAQLAEAQRLFTAMGATGHARRLANELGSAAG